MATRYNYNAEILTRHPEMILVSESPFTWEGFLIVSDLYSAGNIPYPRVKVKLVMPKYPSFCMAQISFGKHIALLRSRKFSIKVNELMKSEVTVLSFLTQLQELIGKHIRRTSRNVSTTIDCQSTKDFLQDIKAALQNPSHIQLSCDRNLNTITLSLRGVFLTLKRSTNIGCTVSWEVVSSNMPAISNFEGFKDNIAKLSIAMSKFELLVELLERAWEQLKEIDENCWVIEPSEPNKTHMYRRIHLSQSISVTITIENLLKPTDIPTLQFFGSDNEVKRQTAEVSKNIHYWNPDCNILENLRMLLNMYEFPEPQDSLDDSKAIIGNRECGICYSEKSEADELPNKICNNEKCMKHFHSACLSKWLQTNAANQVVFDYIHGNCPHCKESISCPIK